jgi:hypothetical protein
LPVVAAGSERGSRGSVAGGGGCGGSAEGADIWEGMFGEQASEVEMYVCPVYLYSQNWGMRVGNSQKDVDDCLFEVLLPPGRHSPVHWVLRNVLMLAVAPMHNHLSGT